MGRAKGLERRESNMPEDLIAAARRARDFARTLSSSEARDAFLELADRWEAEARIKKGKAVAQDAE